MFCCALTEMYVCRILGVVKAVMAQISSFLLFICLTGIVELSLRPALRFALLLKGFDV